MSPRRARTTTDHGTAGRFDWATALRTAEGEKISGDRSLVRVGPRGVFVAAIDGLGRGEKAARAAARAVEVLSETSPGGLAGMIERCDDALRDTRGVVLSVALLDGEEEVLTWAGVGNVEAILVRGEAPEPGARDYLLRQPGIVGGPTPVRVRPYRLDLKPGDALVLATDGIDADFVRGLVAGKPPKEVATRILSGFGSGPDDALVVVVRYLGGAVSRLDEGRRTSRTVTTARRAIATRSPQEADGFSEELLCEHYLEGLRDYLARRDERALASAYEIGRWAFGNEVGLLDMLAIHRRALETLELDAGDVASRQLLASNEFLFEALASFEVARRGFRDSAGVLRHLNERLETEVRRIAHSLHDDVQQALAALAISIEELEREPGRGVGSVLRQIDDIAQRVRELSHELRPAILDDLGLVPAIEALAQGVSRRGRLEVDVVDATLGPIDPAVALALYRVVQEALTNVIKHSRADRVRIELDERGGDLQLAVRDDGTGFDPLDGRGRRSLGLAGMRERVGAVGGRLEVESAPGRGTRIVAVVPSPVLE